MSLVRGVPTAVMHVVDVVPMGDRDVATPLAMPMIVVFMHRVAGRLAFVVMALMLPVNMALVDIVDVVTMRNRDVTTSRAMFVVMLEMLAVHCAGHCCHHRPYRS